MKTDKFGRPIVPCRICGGWTPSLGSKLCDRCWELESRIRRDPEIARKILAKFDAAVKLATLVVRNGGLAK